MVTPGTYIEVRTEGVGLQTGSEIPTGHIGIIGTARQGDDRFHVLTDFEQGLARYGEPAPWEPGARGGNLTLVRALRLLFLNGARTVHAKRVVDRAGAHQDTAASSANGSIADELYIAALEEMAKEPVQIVVIAGSNFTNLKSALIDHLAKTANQEQERLAVVGADSSAVEKVIANSHEVDDKRMVLVAPGLKQQDAATGQIHELPPHMAAAAVAGKLSCLSPSVSITNKSLSGIDDLASDYSLDELKTLTSSRVLVLAKRNGIRIVKGITTHSGAFNSIRVLRMIDRIKAGCRRCAQAFIGRANNPGVRRILHSTLDRFLNSMVIHESLSSYNLELVSDRAMQRRGEVQIIIELHPSGSPDVFQVVMNLDLDG